MRGQQEVSELHVNIGDVEKPCCSTAVDKDVSVCEDVDEHEAQSDTEDVCEGVVAGEAGASEGNMVDEMEDLSQCTDDGSRDDVEQWSDAAKMVDNDLYTLDQIHSFLDETKGKTGVEISDFFPDIEKFVSSVMVVRRTSNYDELSQQKRFRLKKHLTAIRSGKKSGKAKEKSK